MAFIDRDALGENEPICFYLLLISLHHEEITKTLRLL